MKENNFQVPTMRILAGSNNKARVITDSLGNQYLYSYETLIAVFDHRGVMHRTWHGWSATSGRHFMEFCQTCSSTWWEEGRKPYWDSLPVEDINSSFLKSYLS